MKLPPIYPSPLRKRNFLNLSHLFLDWTSVLVGLIVERTATAIALILLARKVVPLEYGQYISAYALITFLAVIPGLGLDSWLLAQGCHDNSEQDFLWGSLVRSRIRALIFWGLGIFLLSFFLPQDTYPRSLIMAIMVGVAFDTLNLLTIATLRCQNRHYSVAILLGTSSLSTLAIAALLPRSSDTLILFSIGRATISIVTFFFGSILVNIRALFKYDIDFPINEILRSARPFLWADISSVIYVRADVNIIGLTAGSVGNSIYGPAINILQMMFLVPRAIFYYIVPKMAVAYHGKSNFSFKRLSLYQLSIQFFLGALLSLFLYFFGSKIIELTFGEAYSSSILVLEILSILPLIRAINFALGAILSTSKNQQSRSVVQMIAAGFNVIANIIVVQRFGITAVGWIYVASELLLLLGYTGITWKKRIVL